MQFSSDSLQSSIGSPKNHVNIPNSVLSNTTNCSESRGPTFWRTTRRTVRRNIQNRHRKCCSATEFHLKTIISTCCIINQNAYLNLMNMSSAALEMCLRQARLDFWLRHGEAATHSPLYLLYARSHHLQSVQLDIKPCY